MKKSIFIISFIILSLFFSYSFVSAANAGEQIVNGMRNTVSGIENGAENVGNGIKNGVQNAGNAVKNATENAGSELKNSVEKTGDNMRNVGDGAYTAARTATETNNNQNTQNWMGSNIWTWIVVGIITIVIIALIWYYVSRNNH